MMSCYYLSFLIDEIWLDLQDNILLGVILFPLSLGVFPQSAFEPSRLDLHSGLAPKGLNAGVKRPECLNGHVSHSGFNEWVCVFRWVGLFLGPDEWA